MTNGKGSPPADSPPERKQRAAAFPPPDLPPLVCNALFDVEDVDLLRRMTGFHRLANGADPEIAREILNVGVQDAIGLAMFDAFPKAPSQMRRFHGRVAQKCRELLAELGAEGVGELGMVLNMEHLAVSGRGQTAVGDQAAFEKELAAIDSLPHTLAAIIEVAGKGKNWWDGVKVAAGRKENRAQNALFAGLAGAYFEAFGEPPNNGPDRYNTEEPTLRWARAALIVATKRAQTRIKLDRSNAPAGNEHPAIVGRLCRCVRRPQHLAHWVRLLRRGINLEITWFRQSFS
jgi:hypothetical protein